MASFGGRKRCWRAANFEFFNVSGANCRKNVFSGWKSVRSHLDECISWAVDHVQVQLVAIAWRGQCLGQSGPLPRSPLTHSIDAPSNENPYRYGPVFGKKKQLLIGNRVAVATAHAPPPFIHIDTRALISESRLSRKGGSTPRSADVCA